jgi:hypothetical protein
MKRQIIGRHLDLALGIGGKLLHQIFLRRIA